MRHVTSSTCLKQTNLPVPAMDADSSYGGSDTAQDSHSAHDPNSSLDASHHDKTAAEDANTFYHKNEITLPVNYDETDHQKQQPSPKAPHYLATVNLNINETLENHSNLEELSKKYNSTNRLNAESPRTGRKSQGGIDNPAFQAEERVPKNGTLKSTFKNSDLNSSVALGLGSPNKLEEPATEAVNLELINLKPMGKDVAGPYENGANGVSGIPAKKETEVEVGNPYDEYFVPVNEHRKYMR